MEDRRGPSERDRLPPGAVGGHMADYAPDPNTGKTPAKPKKSNDRPMNADMSTFVFKATTKSQQVVPGNSQRAYFSMQNRGSTAVYVSFGTNADTASFLLDAGAFYEPYIPPNSSIYVLGSSGGESIVINEGTL